MNLSQVMCCFFGGRCAEEEPRSRTESTRREAPADLGQREAEREKASEDQLGRMEGEGSTTASGSSTRGRMRLSSRLTKNDATCVEFCA